MTQRKRLPLFNLYRYYTSKIVLLRRSTFALVKFLIGKLQKLAVV